MSFSQNAWGWVVFAFSAGGYVPIVVGGIHHPTEVNVATYGLWFILCLMFIGSSIKLGFAGWKLPLGFLAGNVTMLVLAEFLHGTTFNLRALEWVLLFGTTATVAIWVVHGHLAGARNPRILLWGAIAVDVLSCYPIFKQYLFDVHEPMSAFGIAGWVMWIIGVSVNLNFVEEFFSKLVLPRKKYRARFGEEKAIGLLFEASIFSLEQLVLIPATLSIML